jgi:hypothetical protein
MDFVGRWIMSIAMAPPMLRALLLLPFFLPSVDSATCANVQTNLNTRYSTTTDCVDLVDCIFVALSHDGNGGAVSCTATSKSVSIAGSSFLSCHSTGSAARSGALLI